MEINESSKLPIQNVFIRHFQTSSDFPIPRDEFIQAGWDQRVYWTYYRLTHTLFLAYTSYANLCHPSLQFSRNSKELPELFQTSRRILNSTCEDFESFVEKILEFTLSSSSYLSYLESTFLLDSTNFFTSSQRFIALLESFIGKQFSLSQNYTLSSECTQSNMCELFSNYYKTHSGTFTEPHPIIDEKDFLSAGWSSQTYQQYYTLISDLYCSLLLYQNQWVPVKSFIFGGTNRKYNVSKDKIQTVYNHSLKVFLDFINEQLHLTLRRTKEFNYIFSYHSGIIWCCPYYDTETYHDICDSEPLIFFVSFNQFLSWIEYEIGNQLVNFPPESTEPTLTIRSQKDSVNAPWYKLSYHELRQYRFQKTQPARENAKNELLHFNDFNSPDSAERFWLLIDKFICQDWLDEDVANRLEEYEYHDFDLGGDTLYIYKGETKCFRKHHNIESVTATVFARRENTVDININCCCDCHKYFISESEFFHYRDLYGIVCRLKVDHSSSGYAKFPMAEYSILRLYGYNVGKEDNLSDEERQDLLKILIENEYVKKPEILKYLEMFIKMNHGRPEMADSISKWTSDLDYVRELGLENQPKIRLEEIKYAH